MYEIYQRFINGEKFKGVSDIKLDELPINNPADLVGPSKIMQALAEKHSTDLKRKKPNKLGNK